MHNATQYKTKQEVCHPRVPLIPLHYKPKSLKLKLKQGQQLLVLHFDAKSSIATCGYMRWRYADCGGRCSQHPPTPVIHTFLHVRLFGCCSRLLALRFTPKNLHYNTFIETGSFDDFLFIFFIMKLYRFINSFY